MMDARQNSLYAPNITDFLAVSAFQQSENDVDRNIFTAEDRIDQNSSSPSTFDENDSQSAFGVDLSGKSTNLAGKSFTIAAILGLTPGDDDVMNLSVQERLQQNQRHLQNYLYGGHEVQRLNDGFCRSVSLPQGFRQDNSLDNRTQNHLKGTRSNSLTCNTSSSRSKRIRTIFTPEQLERLEAEFERQQYMVGPERLYLAHALQLTEAQVKVWFQNRRIKWRKHHLEVTQQRLAVLQRHRTDDRGDEI